MKMSKQLACFHGNVPGNCGLGFISGINNDRYYTRQGVYSLVRQAELAGGTGFFVSGFVDSKVCKEAYEELCKNYKLVYQSPVRVNRNSNNKFFFCVFDRGGKDRGTSIG
jgi:hypothetical protein